MAFGVILVFMIHQRKLAAKDMLQQQIENHYQKELLKSSIESQEAERHRIAHDLHDEIGALLTTSRIYFNQLSPGHAEEQLQLVSSKMNVLFDEMMVNIRRISHDLRPVILENLGLLEAICSLREKLIECSIELYFFHQISFTIIKDAELNVYRIIQELVGNTLKHAKAANIYIEMKEYRDTFVIIYKDDGVGFMPTEHKNGLGMKSIESRLTLLNGKIEFMKADKGIQIKMEMDIKKLTSHERN